MKKCGRVIRGLLVTILSAALLSGCGGGDGGGGTDGGVTYSGLTTPVAIDANNAEAVSVGTYQTYNEGPASGELADGGIIPLSVLGEEAAYGLDDFSRTVENFLARIDFPAGSGPSLQAATEIPPETVPGECRGTATVSGRVIDDATGRLEIVFNDYQGKDQLGNCSASAPVISGRMTIAVEAGSGTLTFSNIVYSAAGELVSMGGTIVTEEVGSSATRSTFNLALQDHVTGKNFKYENFRVTVTRDTDSDRQEFMGRFYNSEYGYVEMETPEALVVQPGGDWPSSGTLLFAGANDSHLTLTFNSQGAVGVGTDARRGTIDFSYVRP